METTPLAAVDMDPSSQGSTETKDWRAMAARFSRSRSRLTACDSRPIRTTQLVHLSKDHFQPSIDARPLKDVAA